jgi:hypothetical protein
MDQTKATITGLPLDLNQSQQLLVQNSLTTLIRISGKEVSPNMVLEFLPSPKGSEDIIQIEYQTVNNEFKQLELPISDHGRSFMGDEFL